MVRPLVIVLVLMLVVTGARGDDWSDCIQASDRNRQIRGCTRIIDRGNRESQKNRGIAYYNRGIAYQKKGDMDRAIADYDKAIALDPNDAFVYVNRGVAHWNKGDVERAIDDYDKAIALDPNDSAAYVNRGVAYDSEGNKEKTIADFRKAIEIDPSLDEIQTALEALTRDANSGDCKRYFPSIGTTLTVPCN